MVIYARTSDNVLDSKFWSIWVLCIEGGRVVHCEVMVNGAYAMPDFMGMTTQELHDWASYDPTGTHPEVYHELLTKV